MVVVGSYLFSGDTSTSPKDGDRVNSNREDRNKRMFDLKAPVRSTRYLAGPIIFQFIPPVSLPGGLPEIPRAIFGQNPEPALDPKLPVWYD